MFSNYSLSPSHLRISTITSDIKSGDVNCFGQWHIENSCRQKLEMCLHSWASSFVLLSFAMRRVWYASFSTWFIKDKRHLKRNPSTTWACKQTLWARWAKSQSMCKNVSERWRFIVLCTWVLGLFVLQQRLTDTEISTRSEMLP